MTIHFHPAPKPVSPPKPPKLGVRKKNTARAAANFKYAYGSVARVKWVKLQMCSSCQAWGYSENSHVLGNDGASRKGHFTGIAPLCGIRPSDDGGIYEGCHHFLHRDPEAFRARFPEFNAKRAAASTQRSWLTFCRLGAAK